MLYSHVSQTMNKGEPVLVFLHGLLGSSEDWQSTLEHLPNSNWLTIDLPGHAKSYHYSCNDFKHCCQQISDAILSLLEPNTPIVLIGYSLGGRIAMLGSALKLFSNLNLIGLVVEGGNFGLQSDQERNERWQNDSRWAQRFREEPIAQVLSDWYQQVVFSSLNDEQRQTLIAKRSANLGVNIAKMLLSTSLAHQPNLLPALQRLTLPVHYVCGANDQKFRQLAEQSGLVYSQIERAGHNVHQEQPAAFAMTIQRFIDSLHKEVRDNNIGNHNG
ncbi:2-succinyl-6-hydroxy-2,4-cyclohexadiene-1-carboxylate synthase [Vibrio ziniensis]|uniref:Putative 2-succinyl-6-hydroxy-2,4-cyclohexadiene-1-carboxylate synthase n=1 Tax=Vibrio ziniensis TaxID=2711221 RepID=A0A6G7CJG8_9VIBR|nr:2-succinyl-6-hydroxy-2,4-cyclohexadiene-1-carboxylate synthase [Vibrio ziniensis]QIH42255.1 2-succinyl-6-hydroxy-2,4-cyclohexadiene-1-carboxylate synthase [Vibrio ziniensis]